MVSDSAKNVIDVYKLVEFSRATINNKLIEIIEMHSSILFDKVSLINISKQCQVKTHA